MWRRNADFLILISITVLFIPFFGSSSTIDPVLTPRFCVWGIMSLVLLISFVIQLCIPSKNIDCSVLRRIIFPIFCGYFLFSVISLIKAVNITEGVYEVLKISLSVVYLFLATIVLSKNENHILTLVKATVVSGIILSLIGIYEYFTRFFPNHGICNITGTMAQKNQFSSALFLMLPFCLYSIWGFHNYWKFIGFIPTILILTLIVLNQTRSVWLGIFISTCVTTIVVVFLSTFRRLDIPRATKMLFFRRFLYILIVLIMTGAIWGCLYLRSNSKDSLVDRIDSIFSPARNITRISLWRKTLEPIKDNFFLGVGAGNWKIVLPSYGLDDFPDKAMSMTIFYVRPENDYIWVLSETGILGFVFYLAVFAIVISYIIRIMIQASSSSDKLLSILVFFGIVGYMVISFFTFPKERIFHSMFLLLMMAIVISIYHQSSGNQKKISQPFMIVLSIPSLLLLVFVVIIGFVRLNAEVHTKRALASREDKKWPTVIQEIDKGYSAFATLDPMSIPLKWYRGEANFSLNNVSQALEDFQKAYNAHPYNVHVLNNLATCYELQGNHDRAIYYYNKALKIFPQFVPFLINLTAAYYNSGRYEEAYETIKRCKPNKNIPKLERYLKAIKEKLDLQKDNDKDLPEK